MTKYRLIVKLPNVTLNFHIEEYEVINNSYYKIFDTKTQTYRIFDSRICDLIEEVSENEI
jgi:hypothetical protein